MKKILMILCCILICSNLFSLETYSSRREAWRAAKQFESARAYSQAEAACRQVYRLSQTKAERRSATKMLGELKTKRIEQHNQFNHILNTLINADLPLDSEKLHRSFRRLIRGSAYPIALRYKAFLSYWEYVRKGMSLEDSPDQERIENNKKLNILLYNEAGRFLDNAQLTKEMKEYLHSLRQLASADAGEWQKTYREASYVYRHSLNKERRITSLGYLCQAAHMLGKHELAVQKGQQYLKLQNKDDWSKARIYNIMGSSFRALKEYNESVRFLRMVLEENFPGNWKIRAMEGLVATYKEMNNDTLLVRLCEEFLETCTDAAMNSLLRREILRIALKSEDPFEVKNAYNRFMKENWSSNDKIHGMTSYAFWLLKQRKYKEALALATEASQITSASSSYRERALRCLADINKQSGNIKEYQKIQMSLAKNIKREDHFAECITKSNHARAAKNYTLALQLLKQAQEAAETYSELWEALDKTAQIHMDKKEYKQALNYYTRMKIRNISDDQKLAQLYRTARCYHLLGDTKQAEKLYQLVLAEYPNCQCNIAWSFFALSPYAVMLTQQKRFQEIAQIIPPLLARTEPQITDSMRISACYRLLYAYYKLKQYAKGISVGEMLENLSLSAGWYEYEAYRYWGLCYKKMNDWKNAEKTFRQSLEFCQNAGRGRSWSDLLELARKQSVEVQKKLLDEILQDEHLSEPYLIRFSFSYLELLDPVKDQEKMLDLVQQCRNAPDLNKTQIRQLLSLEKKLNIQYDGKKSLNEYLVLTNEALEAKNYKQALTLATKARILSVTPEQQLEAGMLITKIHFEMQHYKEALASCRKTIALPGIPDSQFLTMQWFQTRILNQMDKRNEADQVAVKILEKCDKTNRSHWLMPFALEQLIHSHLNKKETQKAIDCAKPYLDEKYSDTLRSTALCRIIQTCHGAHLDDQAIPFEKILISLKKNDNISKMTASIYLGQCYKRKKDYANAEKYFRYSLNFCKKGNPRRAWEQLNWLYKTPGKTPEQKQKLFQEILADSRMKKSDLVPFRLEYLNLLSPASNLKLMQEQIALCRKFKLTPVQKKQLKAIEAKLK